MRRPTADPSHQASQADHEARQASQADQEARQANQTRQADQAGHGGRGGPGAHGHDHGLPGLETTGGRLLLTLVINLVIPVAQVAGGLLANSMALISDALHNFSDFLALLIAYVADSIGKRPPSAKNTFGYQRAEILSAALNVLTLAVAAGVIVYGAVDRLLHPQAVQGGMVALIAALGVAGNGYSAVLLHRDSKNNLNIRAAFLHMVGDALTSVAVLVNGVILMFAPWTFLDPLLSLVISALILKSCWGVLREAGLILMNATPLGLDVEEVRAALQAVPGVVGVHHLHAWNISSSSIGFSCHIVVRDQPVSHTAGLSGELRRMLWSGFRIDHPIFEFETGECGESGAFCGVRRLDQ